MDNPADATLRLQTALAQVAQSDDAQSRQNLLAALRPADLLVPTLERLGGPPGWRTATEPTTIQPMVVDGPDGAPYLLVFTDEASILNWKPEGRPWVGFHARDVASLVLNNGLAGVVIDVGSARRTVIPGDDLKAVLAGVDAFELPAGVTLGIGPATGIPTGLEDRLRDVLAGQPSVGEAYLYDMAVNNGPPHLTLGLVLSGSDLTAASMMAALVDVVGPQGTLDIRPIDGNEELAGARDAGIALKRAAR